MPPVVYTIRKYIIITHTHTQNFLFFPYSPWDSIIFYFFGLFFFGLVSCEVVSVRLGLRLSSLVGRAMASRVGRPIVRVLGAGNCCVKSQTSSDKSLHHLFLFIFFVFRNVLHSFVLSNNKSNGCLRSFGPRVLLSAVTSCRSFSCN